MSQEKETIVDVAYLSTEILGVLAPNLRGDVLDQLKVIIREHDQFWMLSSELLGMVELMKHILKINRNLSMNEFRRVNEVIAKAKEALNVNA